MKSSSHGSIQTPVIGEEDGLTVINDAGHECTVGRAA